MGPRRLTFALTALAACGPKPAAQEPVGAAPSAALESQAAAMPATPTTLRERVVADFEAAIKQGSDAYVALFDFHAVGEMEILLHRYDLYGRLPRLPDDVRGQFAGEGAEPYAPERERQNVGKFYDILGRRTVGGGGCVAREPRTEYAQKLGTFEPLPQGTLVDYEPLRQKALGYLAKGGVVALSCSGGKGGIALVYTERPNARGYDLITIYDD